MTLPADGTANRAVREMPARDGEQINSAQNGQDWLVSWHPPGAPPEGTPHGSAGICVTADGEVVLISEDGVRWDVPAGRPEGSETWEETLRREMLEEACATVVQARLLGFGRGVCVAGLEAGLVLVRSMWRADVELGPWEPRFEILHRRLVAPADLVHEVSNPDGFARILSRALQEAGLS